MKYSIIMAAYNTEAYIADAIKSVLSQTFANWELIIVDDGSKDETGAIADAFSAGESRILVVHQDNSGTASAARNTALKHVTGDYIQMLDSDDRLSEDCLARYEAALSDYQRSHGLSTEALKMRISALSPICYSTSEQGEVLHEVSSASKLVGKTLSGEEAFVLSLDWRIHGIICVSREIFKAVRFDTHCLNGDELTGRKLFANSDLVLFTGGHYYYRMNSGSTTRSSANRARMFEALHTDGNIYKYALERNMESQTQKLCEKKWLKSMMAHTAKLRRDNKLFSDNERQNIIRILETNYAEIQREGIGTAKNGLFGFLFLLSGGSFERYSTISALYNFAWLCRERLTHQHSEVLGEGL